MQDLTKYERVINDLINESKEMTKKEQDQSEKEIIEIEYLETITDYLKAWERVGDIDTKAHRTMLYNAFKKIMK